jgi:hypothetical protein
VPVRAGPLPLEPDEFVGERSFDPVIPRGETGVGEPTRDIPPMPEAREGRL